MKECSIATQPRVLVPETQKWRFEDYLFVESAAGSATEALYLVTQFLGERQGDGFFLIPAVRGVSYAITCGSKSRRVVQQEHFVEAPGSCEFVFTSHPRSLSVKGAGYPAEEIKMPTGDPPGSGTILTNVGVWTYVNGKPVSGTSIKGMAIPGSDAGFFYMRKGKDLLVINLKRDWTEMWFRSESGNLASVIRGDDRLCWKPTYVLKGIDWSVIQKARGARIFRASLQY